MRGKEMRDGRVAEKGAGEAGEGAPVGERALRVRLDCHNLFCSP